MIRMWMTALAVMVVAWAPSGAEAQSVDAIAGWIGLTATPVGGFTPVHPVSGGDGVPRTLGAQARYGHWQFASDDDNTTNLGLGVVIPVRRSSVTLEVGRTTKKDCGDCDMLLIGLDAHIPVWTSDAPDGWGEGTTLGIGLNPAIGYGNEGSGSDFTAFAAAFSVPASISASLGERMRIAPFISPGVGLGRVSAGDDSESGIRAMLGGGVAVGSGRAQVTGSFRRVFIEDGATVLGVALSVHR